MSTPWQFPSATMQISGADHQWTPVDAANSIFASTMVKTQGAKRGSETHVGKQDSQDLQATAAKSPHRGILNGPR